MKHDVPKREGGDDRTPLTVRQARVRAALRLRGVLKLTILTIAVAQALAFAFESLLVMTGFAPDAATVLLFRFVTCALVSFWLQADALRAYQYAAQHGFVAAPGAHGDPVDVAPQCPKRWLVVLSLQLDPRGLNGERIK
ncbi:TPA: hypothetical protein QDC20_007096 [Burkholderia aenigmatica]|uniref:hypothetical protein n=1 Tax=Burkholderia sp. AU45251 TaxID=3059204 RepID=UPI00264DBCC6|nr:hypothetical protein [Burkholderia sp. AU45251]HDR9488289.1 hypothetical protein [Burkholderia aenigmatica]MDN7515422.1 hypothetical protein [Burkholderia sp. AU45251]HDR9520108.1 hypothetical protein [Burkholderia aenigmatica]HDR9597214.1 hypothetical protein [Burkholderia aenigmatica]HDR9605148.1 hypothetical protein [Burkholderia aenigmatica]